MGFYARYELLDLTRDGAVKTFAARQKATGRDVSAHLLVGGRAVHAALMDRIESLPASARSEILESGDHEGTPFVVTSPWLRRESFAEWAMSGGGAPAAPDPYAKAGTWRIPESEFGRKSAPTPETRTIAHPAATPPVPLPEPEPVPSPQPPEPQPGTPVVGMFTGMFEAEKAKSGPEPDGPGGEFTRMFASVPKPVAADEMVTAEIPLAAAPAAHEPGEFTRMFQVPAQTAPPPPAAPPPQREAGEFTRMFQTPAQTPPPPPAAPPPQREAGEFTRMFQTPAQTPPPPPAAPPPQREAGEFTRMFQTPAQTAPPPPAAPPPQREAGEFTRVFQTPPQAAPPPPAAPSPQSAAPGEFTKFFEAPPPPDPSHHPAYRDPLGKQQPQGHAPTADGEFTRMFGTPSPAGAHPPISAQQPAAAGDYTRMFATPATASAPQAPPAAATPPPPQQQGPGEFTRMFAAPPPPSTIAPPPPSTASKQAPQAAPRKASYLPLFLILGGLLVVAVALLVVFALRK